MKTLLIVLLACFNLAHAQEVLTAAKFTDVMAKELARLSPQRKVVVKAELRIDTIAGPGDESTMFLDNAYQSYLRDPRALDQIVRTYASSHAESRDKSLKVDSSLIVPIIKDRGWLAEVEKSLKARGANTPPESVSEAYNDSLIILYAEDLPTSVRYFTAKELEELGIERSKLRALAANNLKRRLPKIEVHEGPLVSMITAGGDFEASLLLLDIWSDGKVKVDGEIVVAIPSRDLLVYTGSKNAAGVAKLREVATRAARASPYRLTDELFVLRNGQFVKFLTP